MTKVESRAQRKKELVQKCVEKAKAINVQIDYLNVPKPLRGQHDYDGLVTRLKRLGFDSIEEANDYLNGVSKLCKTYAHDDTPTSPRRGIDRSHLSRAARTTNMYYGESSLNADTSSDSQTNDGVEEEQDGDGSEAEEPINSKDELQDLLDQTNETSFRGRYNNYREQRGELAESDGDDDFVSQGASDDSEEDFEETERKSEATSSENEDTVYGSDDLDLESEREG